MTEASVRAAIKSYMDAGAIPGVQDAWYQDEPWFLAGQSWKLSTNGGAGAIGYIHLDEHEEFRMTVGGVIGTKPAGQKMVHHTVSFVLQYQYLIPGKLATGFRQDDWVRPLDTILDGTIARIQNDPTFGCGTNGPIFDAGQGYNGSAHIRVQRDLPVQPPGGGKVFSWNRIAIDVLEIITA